MLNPIINNYSKQFNSKVESRKIHRYKLKVKKLFFFSNPNKHVLIKYWKTKKMKVLC